MTSIPPTFGRVALMDVQGHPHMLPHMSSRLAKIDQECGPLPTLSVPILNDRMDVKGVVLDLQNVQTPEQITATLHELRKYGIPSTDALSLSMLTPAARQQAVRHLAEHVQDMLLAPSALPEGLTA